MSSFTKFRPYFFTLSLLFFAQIGQAQVKNFNYFKLLIINENNEVLLVDFKDMWEPMGKKYDSPESMKKVLNSMAAEVGVEAKDYKLRAMITKFYGQAQYPIVFNYVTAKYVSGDITIPPGCKGIDWYSKEEALKIIPFEGMRLVVEQMFKDNNQELWGGSLNILTDPETKQKTAKILEDFYPY